MERLKSRQDLMKQLEIVSKSKGLTTFEIVDVQTNQKGEGYLGEIFLVSLIDPKSKKTLDLVIKSAFQDEKVRRVVPIRMSFENEIYFYSRVQPAFLEFARARGLDDSILDIIPECYQCCTENESELLILQNLKSAGFEIFDKRSILDEEHVTEIFKTYGRFHAFSFAMKEQEPEKYQSLIEGLHDLYTEFVKNEIFEVNLVGISKIIDGYFIPGQDDKIRELFEKYKTKKVVELFSETLESNCDYSVIVHGDCWSNNMMFKYKNHGNEKELSDIRLIDFQLMKPGSPVCDLSYFFYSGASKSLYDRLDEFLKIYHESLSETLKLLGGSDAEKLFPLKALREEWKKYARFGLLMGLMILKMKATDQEDMIDLTDDIDFENNKSAFIDNKFKEDVFSSRSLGLVQHVYQIDVL